MKPPKPLALDDLPAGPQKGGVILDLTDLPEHGGKDVVFTEGGFRLQLFVQRYNGEIYVYENRCPHAGTPLNLFDDRFLDTSGNNLICRTHGALFAPDSGKCLRGPCKGEYLRPVLFEIRDGTIYAV